MPSNESSAPDLEYFSLEEEVRFARLDERVGGTLSFARTTESLHGVQAFCGPQFAVCGRMTGALVDARGLANRRTLTAGAGSPRTRIGTCAPAQGLTVRLNVVRRRPVHSAIRACLAG